MNADNQFPDLDKMLSAFFQAEIPSPFPAMKIPLAAPGVEMAMPAGSGVTERPRPLVSKSRLSLAVSMALLLGGCWYLSSQIGTAPNRAGVGAGNGDGSATIPKTIRKALEASKKNTNMP